MNTVAHALEDVDRAFRHLEFSVKLMCYCELDHIDRDKFDTDVTILLEKENVGFPANTFASLEAIVSAAQANVGVSFGVTAIVLDAAFEVAGIRPDTNSSSRADALRCLVYMVRCAFAHNPALPCWEVRGDYAKPISLKLEEMELQIDFSKFHAKPFEYDHIGGLASWFRIRRVAEQVINGT